MEQPQPDSGCATMAKSESNKFQKKNAWLDQPYTSKPVVVAAVHTWGQSSRHSVGRRLDRVHFPHSSFHGRQQLHPSESHQMRTCGKTTPPIGVQCQQLCSPSAHTHTHTHTQPQTRNTACIQRGCCKARCYPVLFCVYKDWDNIRCGNV